MADEPKKPPQRPENIPVKQLVLVEPIKGIKREGYHNVISTVETSPNRDTWDVTYIPQMRHHRIEFAPGGDRAKLITKYVHETRVQEWEPAA